MNDQKSILVIIVLMFVITISKAQSIPNAGFEIWSNPNGYNMPDAWGNLNDISSGAGVYTCIKGTPGVLGASYIKLTSKNVTGMGVMPGIAVSGVLDVNTLEPISGFAYSLRPTFFTGNWQYMGNSANDNGYIKVYLFKWNTGMNMLDTVGYAIHNLNGMVMSWTNFSIPFSYNNSDSPDSCIIVLSASGANPEANSYLYVDNLNFTVPTTGIESTEITGIFSIYPNPSSDLLNVELSGIKSTILTFEIIDLQGKVVWSKKADNSLLQSIPISQLSTGRYTLKLETVKGIVTQKFVKQ